MGRRVPASAKMGRGNAAMHRSECVDQKSHRRVGVSLPEETVAMQGAVEDPQTMLLEMTQRTPRDEDSEVQIESLR